MVKNLKLSKKDFYKFLDQYQPLPDQSLEDRPWMKLKKKPMNCAIYWRIRFYNTLRFALKYLRSEHPLILDIGVYPGTLMCLMSDLLPRYNLNPVFCGIGLSIKPGFIELMEKRCRTKIESVNIDPDNPDLKGKPYPTRIPFEDNSVDIVFATEIIEHLTNPRYMLSEAYRVLKSSGVIVITTPNVTRIGSVFKLLIGRSINDRIMPVGYSNPDDEWRPHFREYSMGELINLLGEEGFKVVDSTIYRDHMEFAYKTIKQKFIDAAKTLFEFIPHLRGNTLIVGMKV